MLSSASPTGLRLAALLVAVAVVGGLLICAPVMHAVDQTWTGTISASHCGLSHPDNGSPRDCTLECVGNGAAFVLVASGKIYTFENQADERLQVNAGRIVTVKGELHGDILAATSIVAGQQR
jgi:hypothetical protein